MGLLRKISAAFRGQQHESLQLVVDMQAIRILEQEIRDCQHSIAKAKAQLTKVVVEHKGGERELEQLKKQASSIEKKAAAALDSDDEALAVHLSRQIADIESAIGEQQKHLTEMLTIKSELRDNLLTAERQIKQHMRDVRLAKAYDSAQKGVTSSNVHGTQLASQLDEVRSSLARIKERRLHTDDLSAAAKTVDAMLGGKPECDSALRGSEILARLRQQHKAQMA